MFPIIPAEIYQIIFGHVEDKETLARLLLVSHTFRRLAEPYLYRDVSFRQQKEDTIHTIHKFLLSLAAAGGRCTRFVKRIHLPIIPPRSKLYPLFQAVFALVTNLEDLQFYPSEWTPLISKFDLHHFFNGASGPPSFVLKRFSWHSHCSLDGVGLTWFLACQRSLKFLLLMSVRTSGALIPTLPRLRVLHAWDLTAARKALKTNQVTHLQIQNFVDSLDLGHATFPSIVVCVLHMDKLDVLAEAFVRMFNLECLEIDIFLSPIPSTLSQLVKLKGATKLRRLRIRTASLLNWHDWQAHPWDYNDVQSVFDGWPSLSHISIQLVPVATDFPEYYDFTKGALQPTKLRLRYPEHDWWHDWTDDHVSIPFAPNEHPQIGYKGDLHGVAVWSKEDQRVTPY